MQQAVVLYDGQCGLCARAVRTGRRHGRSGALRFVDNRSPEAMAALERHGLLAASEESMVVLVGEKAFQDSAAVIQVAARLRGVRRLGATLWVVPKPVRDALYHAVAKRRHTLCPLP